MKSKENKLKILKLFIIGIILFFIISPVNKVFLFLTGKSTKAKIINLSITKAGGYNIQNYTYEFTAENGLTYSGFFASNNEAPADSHKYGDFIEVQYYEQFPSINRIRFPIYIIEEKEVIVLTLGVILIFIIVFLR